MTVVERGAVVAVALLVARGALSVMMWHTRSVTFLVVMYRSCLVMELQTRESGATVRVALLSRCKMPVRAPRNTTITCGARGHTSACGGERHVVCGGRRGCWLVRVAPASSSKAAQADHLEHAHEQKKVAKCRDVQNIHMAALLLNTLIGNAVLPLDSSTPCKAHREVSVATHWCTG